ncbi:MAG: DUF4198 domain-containing protein, partial [Planctomycetota bacterium]
MSQAKLHSTRFVSFAALALWATSATAHQVWVETGAIGVAGQEQLVHVCWGHTGDKGTGESLEKQQGRLSAWVMRPDGQAGRLELAIGSDSFTAKFTPSVPGSYMIGAERQSGILTREFHGIPANTRIVMYGKSFTHVEGSNNGLSTPLGMDLEVVPVSDPNRLRPGDIATAKVLFKGKPIGGKDVVVSLNTLGTEPFPEDPTIQGLVWSVESNAEPQTGEVSFPLIVCGRHQFYIRYMDETPGRYEGDREVTTDYSHLRKG